MTDIDISVVIVTWNQLAFLKECLISLRQNARECQSEIIVVDNGSSDGSREFLQQQSELRTIYNDTNAGVSRARNQGIEKATGRYIYMLDDDTVVHSGCLDRFVNFMDAYPEVWLSGGKQVSGQNILIPTARSFYNPLIILARRSPWGKTLIGKRQIRKHLMQDWDHQDNRTVDWVSGASFCMRASAVEKIGPLDSGYFFGFEDLEWAYRVWNHGGKVAYLHDAIITHYVQRSSKKLFSRRAMDHFASMIRFYVKNGFRRPSGLHTLSNPLIFE